MRRKEACLESESFLGVRRLNPMHEQYARLLRARLALETELFAFSRDLN